MSISKKDTSLLLIIVLVIAVFAMMAIVATYAGDLPWATAPHLVAHCAGSTCGLS